MTLGVWHHRHLGDAQSGSLTKVVGGAPTFLSVLERHVPTGAFLARAKVQKRAFGMALAVLGSPIASVTPIKRIATTRSWTQSLMNSFPPFGRRAKPKFPSVEELPVLPTGTSVASLIWSMTTLRTALCLHTGTRAKGVSVIRRIFCSNSRERGTKLNESPKTSLKRTATVKTNYPA
jgi:hypothetical protein